MREKDIMPDRLEQAIAEKLQANGWDPKTLFILGRLVSGLFVPYLF